MMDKYKIQEYGLLALIVVCGLSACLMGYHIYDRNHNHSSEPKIAKDTVPKLSPDYDITMEWIYEEEGLRGPEKRKEALKRREEYKLKVAKLKADSIRAARERDIKK